MAASALSTSPATPVKGQKKQPQPDSERPAGSASSVDTSNAASPAQPVSQRDCFTPQKPSSTPQPSTPSRRTGLTDSSESPHSLSESQQSPDTPKARQQGARDMQITSASKPTASTQAASSPTPSSSSSTWQPFSAGRTRTGTQLQSSPIYTTPARFRSADDCKSRTASNTPSGSKFSFLASKMAALKSFTSPSMSTHHDSDELANLDIEAALFPAGAPQEGDSFSPAAFKNLQMNAMGVASKFQTAYQRQSVQLRTLRAEREAMEDEKDEAETRVRHFKMQLEEMARKAAETESQMQALMDELNREKKLRRSDRSSRGSRSEVSTISEDLGAERDQRKKLWRQSGETVKTDTSFETDDESMESSSVFSRSRSPTLAASISDISPVEPSMPLSRNQTPDATSPKSQQMSTFQKLIKGISGEQDTRFTTDCNNCRGQEASVAWDTAGVLRDENRGLKLRVTDLESALEGALDVVNGIGM